MFALLLNKSLNYGGIFDFAHMTADLQELEAQMGQPHFWNDARAAAAVSRKKATIERELQQWRDIETAEAESSGKGDLGHWGRPLLNLSAEPGGARC